MRQPYTPTALLLLALALCLGGCTSDEAEAPAQRGGSMPFPVEVLTVAREQVEYVVSAVGSVEAYEEVTVTARVSGAVDRVRFMEGDFVEQGTILAEIEPERFRVNVRSAKASYERANAAKADAEAALRRRRDLAERNPGLVREEELQTFRTQAQVARSEAAQARAALDLAELNQRDALVRAPFAGIVQSRDVRTGQYLQPGGVIATLIREEPLLLRFQVPENDAARMETGMQAYFHLTGGRSREHAAEIIHIAASARSDSRMVPVTARIEKQGDTPPEQGRALRPGAFAQIRVPVEVREDAIVIPQLAVRPSERGFITFVVDDEDQAREHIVKLGMRTAGGRVEILEGLDAGMRLVVRGTEALRDGVNVRITERVSAQEARERDGKSTDLDAPRGNASPDEASREDGALAP